MLTNQYIAVLKGGPGSERPVSLASAAGVSKALRELGATVTEVDVTGPDFDAARRPGDRLQHHPRHVRRGRAVAGAARKARRALHGRGRRPAAGWRSTRSRRRKNSPSTAIPTAPFEIVPKRRTARDAAALCRQSPARGIERRRLHRENLRRDRAGVSRRGELWRRPASWRNTSRAAN